MILRNKKTGNIFKVGEELDIGHTITGKIKVEIVEDNKNVVFFYKSLEEFNNTWEDYKIEPLIEKKFRKIIREWSKVNGYTRLIYDKKRDCLHSPYCAIVCITFYRFDVFEKLEDGKSYDITELCGEEDKDERSE